MKDVWCKYFVYNCWYTWYKCINKVFFFPVETCSDRICTKESENVCENKEILFRGFTAPQHSRHREHLCNGRSVAWLSCWLTVCGLKYKNTSKHTSINSYSKSSEATVRIHLHLVTMAVWDDSKYDYSRFVTHPSVFSFPAERFTSWSHAKHVAV